MDFSEVKSVFGFRVQLGNPDLEFENLNPDFPIERTLRQLMMVTNQTTISVWVNVIKRNAYLYNLARSRDKL